MFNKCTKDDIKDEVINEILNKYKDKIEQLEKECKIKYHEYRIVKSELKLTEKIILELQNNPRNYSYDEDFNNDTEISK